MVKLLSPENGAILSVRTDVQRDFFRHCEEYSLPAYRWRERSGADRQDLTVPPPVVFSWESNEPACEFVLTETESGETVFRQIGGNTASVYNLYLGRSYTWRVGNAEPRVFTVEDETPRWIFSEGTYNVRDIGGWKTPSGKIVPQGLAYRGCELDEFYHLTETGLDTMRNTLHIRTDIDLRGESVNVRTESPLGPDIRYEPFHMYAYCECISLGKDVCRDIFDVLQDPSAYPVYIHCMAGADRTGTLVYLLQALLGMDEESMALDYELTTLSNLNAKSRHDVYYESLLADLHPYGDDPRSRAENFLLDCGVKKEALDRIRTIFRMDV